ncbi:MAG: ABC transporter ATP-binding protein [Synergistaceae bacterium]|jgi:oligopeptide/dipeptide ABC transporter ATP-binding protein|nr:ABC transporter ATP-binding protein [Synergistaceae bacterium]
MKKSETLLSLENLSTSFFTSKGVVPAVSGVSLSVKRGEIHGIVGESGCGKSVTSLSIMGLVAPPGRIVEGRILFEGRDLAKLDNDAMCEVRGNEIAMIFQEPMTSLNPVFTVGRQVSESILIHRKVTREEAKKRTIEMFRLVGIPEPEGRFDCYPHQLSGGLRQRVMIAMALVCEPKLLIADEPTTALDVTIQAQILDLMKGLREKLKTAIILITHDLGVVAELCDRVTVMYAGNVVEEAEICELFDSPSHPYTQGLMGSIPGTAASRGLDGRLRTIPGMVPNLLNLPAGCRFHPRCPMARAVCQNRIPPLFDLGDGHTVRCWNYEDKAVVQP